jgi:mono/diheme cytochrome c family protein
MRRSLLPILALAALLAACTQKNTADQDQAGSAAADVALGVNRFLLFPNPIGMDPAAPNGGTFETDTTVYAQTYYAAIDPSNNKDTIDKWKTANGFTGTESATEHLVVFRDVKDLGYGRRMTGRFNTGDGSVAFYVENYNVAPNGSGGYASVLNVDAAIRRDAQWHVGTNAIEWSFTPCIPNYDPADCDNTGTVKFAKYYNFSSADGTRQLAVDLDGRGKKAMPGPCITCHGGRGDPLTPPDATGKPRFPLVENSVSRKRGDVQARLHGQNVDSFSYSTTQPGFAKTDLAPKLKDFNQWILCTYPRDPTSDPALFPPTVSGGWGTCTRPQAGLNEWQGTAADMIQSWYGGAGMPNGFKDTYVPAGWSTGATIAGTTPPVTDTAFYLGVVAPYCRTCHILRGTKNQDDIDFMTMAKFQGFADRIKVLVFDRGNMPNAEIPHTDFWSSSAPQTLANFIDAQFVPGTATSNGTPLMPGRPIADPGPDRMVRTNANAVLSGENSLFTGSYSWTNVSGPSTPSITNATSSIAIFNASVPGKYVVRLTVDGGVSKDVNIYVDDNFPDPLNIRFAHVKNVLQKGGQLPAQKCVTCHKDIATPLPITTPPIWYTDFDRDGSGGAPDATDDAWSVKAISGRVNLTEVSASPLLRKPTGNHHGGNKLIDVTDTSSGGGLSSYSILYNWILGGMQAGGVAANALVTSSGLSSPFSFTFSGAFPGPYTSPAINLDASASIGATGFQWSVTPPNGVLAQPVIANPSSATTTLTVFDIGTYVVQLQATDGVTTDTTTRTIVVNENPIGASFSPPNGTTAITFSGSPSRGNVTLTSTSTGNPTSCQWQILSGPAGALLDGLASTSVTVPCSSPAQLNVPFSATSGAPATPYQVQLIASTVTSSTSTVHSITVANGTPVVASIVANGGVNPASRSFTGGNPATGLASTATVSLNGSASSGVLPLAFAWSVTAQPDSTNGAASLSSTTAASPTLTVRATGSYTVRLQVTDAANNTNATTSTFSVTPQRGTTFATMTADFVNFGCTGCHSFINGATNPDPANNSGNRPSWALENDSNGKTLWRRAFQRTDLGAGTSADSLLLLNPSNTTDATFNPNGHGGGCYSGFICTGGSANYTTFQNWILDGAPPGN